MTPEEMNRELSRRSRYLFSQATQAFVSLGTSRIGLTDLLTLE